MPLEDTIGTGDYRVRHLCGALDFLRTNAYTAYRHFPQAPSKLNHRQFDVALVMGLLHNPWVEHKLNVPLLQGEGFPSTPGTSALLCRSVVEAKKDWKPCLLELDGTPNKKRRCAYCGTPTRYHCTACSDDRYLHICAPTGRSRPSVCYARHLMGVEAPPSNGKKLACFQWSVCAIMAV